MTDSVATAYPTSTSSGNPERQYIQHQYNYQGQTTSPGGHQYYSEASEIEQQQQQQQPQQLIMEAGDQQAVVHQGQEVNYAQYTHNGVEFSHDQQISGGGFFEQNNAGVVQQYAGTAGPLVQSQEQHGYKINFDPNPQIIRKNANDAVTYKQEVAVRYLRPPTPPPPGPLVIKEVRNPAMPPAPPIVIRQRPPRPSTPPPLIIRERPPQPPPQLAPKVVTKPLPPPPPPPRRVIIERMPPLPPKPQSVIVERWLPYKQQKRRVIYQKAPPIQAPTPQKNLIIQWEGTQARVVKEFRNLGIIRADPNTYVQQYGTQLRPTNGLPDFVKSLPTPNLGPEYGPISNLDQVDPALLAGATGPVNGYEAFDEQGLLVSASNGSLTSAGQNGYIQENVQYAGYDNGVANGAGQVSSEQQGEYSYQQSAYSTGSTAEGRQYAAEQQQDFEQQGNNFVQNVQYQSMPQYSVSG